MKEQIKILIILAILFFAVAPSPRAFAATIGGSSATLTAGSSLNSGLVGHWTFDGKDTTNGVAKDLSGQGNTGNLFSISTSTFYALGKLGQAFKFDGTDDFASTTATGLPTSSTAGTWSMWINPTGTTGGIYSTSAVIDTNSSLSGMRFKLNSSTSYDFGIGWASDYNVACGKTMTNTWTHIVVTRTSAGAWNGYCDGVVKKTQTDTSTWVQNSSAIGRFNGGDFWRYFPGKIDDVRIYNRALTAAEVKQLYQLGGATKNASSATLTAGSTLTSGLVGHWTFDGKNITSGRADDISGQANHGNLFSISTSTFYAAGKLGQAFNIDGSNDYVSMGDKDVLDVQTGNMTISAWVLRKGTTGLDGNQPIIGKGTDTTYTYLLFSDNSGNLTFGLYDGTNNPQATVSSLITASVWHHVVGLYDGTNLYIYIDGVQKASTGKSGFSGSGTTGAFQIGQWPNQGGTRGHFNGLIDDPRIYNRALSAAEVKQLYQLGGATKNASSATLTAGSSLTSGLVGHWTFDGKDMISGAVRDVSGNGNTGNLFNISTSTFYKAGKLGQAFNFDGSNDYISRASSASLQITADLTISVWMKPSDGQPAADSSVVTKWNTSKLSYNLGLKNSGKIILYLSSNGTTLNHKTTDSAVFSDGTVTSWSLITAVYSASGQTVTFYVNGSSVPSSVTGGAIPSSINSNTSTFEIASDAGGQDPYFGSLDDVRVYNRALSAAEVKQLYLMK